MKHMPCTLAGSFFSAPLAAVKQGQTEGAEPCSVLDHRRSPSPPTSSNSTLSADVAAVSDKPWKEDWAADLQPLPLDPSSMADDDAWDSLLLHHPPDTSSLLRWLSDPEQPHPPGPPQLPPLPDLDPSLLLLEPPVDPNPPPPPPPLFYHEPNLPTSPFRAPAPAVILPVNPLEQQGVVDQLLAAGEQIEAGNHASAQVILARLNHLSPHHGKPLLRSSFYLREALSGGGRGATPWDVVLKLTAHRAFAELSPVPHFAAFTCVQALLEELPAGRVHVVDLDLGAGAHWSSFLQELSHRHAPSLRVTALVSAATHHPLELALVQDNLAHFAADLGVPFELRAIDAESLDHTLLAPPARDEALAVHLPAAACASAPAFLRLVKQLAPKVLIAVDHGCDRGELPLPQRLLQSLRSCAAILESIDATGAIPDVAAGIGRFLLQPRFEASLHRLRRPGDGPPLPWRTILASAGFTPLQFSNFAETQAECLLKRTPIRGFQVERRQSSLALLWQREELVSISAWRC